MNNFVFYSPTEFVFEMCIRDGYNRFRKSFTKKITPHARKPIDPSLPLSLIHI